MLKTFFIYSHTVGINIIFLTQMKATDCCEILIVAAKEGKVCAGEDGCGHFFRQKELFTDHVHYVEEREKKEKV